VNPGVVLAAVQADLSQVSAIQEVARARAAVSSMSQGVAAATSGLRAAMAAQTRAQAGASKAQANVAQASARLRQLAVAAYMGLGYLTPAAGPVGDQPASDGTVTSPGGLTGGAATDALEMVRVVATHERKDLAQSTSALVQAGRTVRSATAGVNGAQATLARAETALSSSRQTLTLMTRAATTPGLAATLNLPNPSSPPVTSPPAGAPSSPSGPTSIPGSWIVESDATTPMPTSPTILGPPVLSAAEMARWFASTKQKANTTVPIAQLTQDYVDAGQQTGVRPDLAFAQSIVETGYFSFPSYGQLTKTDNNFAGIGACDTCAHGWRFPNAATGVAAQMELLEAYASPTPVPTPLLGSIGVGGCCPTWLALAGKWASSTTYGISILATYHRMLNWLIPQRLIDAGLLAPPKPAPAIQTPASSSGGQGNSPLPTTSTTPTNSTTSTIGPTGTPPTPASTASGSAGGSRL
jgi:hypothetical protein